MNDNVKDFIQGVAIGSVLMYGYITLAHWHGF